MAVDSRALTTAANVKTFLHISGSGDDALLESLIDRVSDKIERYCSRRFKAENYVQWLNGNREDVLQIRHYPIIYVDAVAIGSTDCMSVSYSGSELTATAGVHFDADGGTGSMRLVSAATGETTKAFSSFATVGALVTDINDNVADWTASTLTDVPTADIRPMGGRDAKSDVVYFEFADCYDSNYTVDFNRGQIHYRPPRGHANVLVKYRGGYETVPDDVEQLCIEMVGEAYHKGKKGMAVTSESLGDYSYTLAGEVAIDEARARRLMPYIDLPVGGAA